MSFSRVKPAGWAANETLTSAQQNQVDINISNSCDKRAGGSDTLQGTYAFTTGTQSFSGVTSLTMTGTNKVSYASRAKDKMMPRAWFWNGTGWSYDTSAKNLVNATTGAAAKTPLHLPNGATLNSVSVRYIGTGHSALPANMPSFKIWRIDSGADNTLQVGSTATDASGSTGVLDAEHNITLSSIAHTVDNSVNSYELIFTAESGANSQTGGQILWVTVNCTITSQAEW